MEGMEGIWRFVLIALLAVAAGAGVGILLGGANSDAYDTVVKTVKGERRTVTKTETQTVTSTRTETAPDPETALDPEGVTGPAGGGAAKDDDADGDSCSDSYKPVCVDPYDGYTDLDCRETGEEDFSSTGDDPYRLDPDRNGVACESTASVRP